MAEKQYRIRGTMDIVMYVKANSPEEALEKAHYGEYERYDEWDISVGDEALEEDDEE